MIGAGAGRVPADRAACRHHLARHPGGPRDRVLVLRPDHRPERRHVAQLRDEARPARRHQPRHRRARRRQPRGGPHRHVRRQREPDQDRDPRRAARPHPDRQHHHVARRAARRAVPHRPPHRTCPRRCSPAIVFLIGLGLIDFRGLRRIRAARVERVRDRAASPRSSSSPSASSRASSSRSCCRSSSSSGAPTSRRDFLVGVDDTGDPTYVTAHARRESLPGLIVFRFDARLFYANANLFVDDIQRLIDGAPDPVRWLVLDARRSATSTTPPALGLAGCSTTSTIAASSSPSPGSTRSLRATLHTYGLGERITGRAPVRQPRGRRGGLPERRRRRASRGGHDVPLPVV